MLIATASDAAALSARALPRTTRRLRESEAAALSAAVLLKA